MKYAIVVQEVSNRPETVFHVRQVDQRNVRNYITSQIAALTNRYYTIEEIFDAYTNARLWQFGTYFAHIRNHIVMVFQKNLLTIKSESDITI